MEDNKTESLSESWYSAAEFEQSLDLILSDWDDTDWDPLVPISAEAQLAFEDLVRQWESSETTSFELATSTETKQPDQYLSWNTAELEPFWQGLGGNNDLLLQDAISSWNWDISEPGLAADAEQYAENMSVTWDIPEVQPLMTTPQKREQDQISGGVEEPARKRRKIGEGENESSV
ncbi:hypothetical protein QBC35DRAFT_477559 [Podospora australis]|uniref:Uncharacterized protein n=1 Tax=Podospora australis TaxID=1536484 RepID=A0AAN7AEZ0_9PEZI|nr:hypothetical protein QBC35DRAFT_477559 [Podospora australis]